MNTSTVLGYAGRWPLRHTVSIPQKNRLSHMLVVGMTGVGKTTTLRSVLAQDMSQGRSIVVIDGKGDPGILGPLIKNFNWVLFGAEVEGNLSYNPLIGSPDQVVSAFIDAFGFHNEYYEGCATRLITTYLRLCEKLHKVPTIRELSKMALSIAKFMDQGSQLEDAGDLIETLEALGRLSEKAYMEQFMGLANRLDVLVQSAWGDHLCASNAGNKPGIDFDSVFDKPGHLYIGLQKLANRKGAMLLGRLVLARIGNLAAKRAASTHKGGLTDRPIVSVIVDELAGIAYPGFETLPQRVRSSKIMLTLSTQTLSDLSAVSPDFLGQIQTNTGVKIIHQQNSDVDADVWAKHIGTRMGSKGLFDQMLEAVNPLRFPRERRFIIGPDELKNLPEGHAVIEIMERKKKRHEIVSVIDVGSWLKSREAA